MNKGKLANWTQAALFFWGHRATLGEPNMDVYNIWNCNLVLKTLKHNKTTKNVNLDYICNFCIIITEFLTLCWESAVLQLKQNARITDEKYNSGPQFALIAEHLGRRFGQLLTFSTAQIIAWNLQ